VIPPRGSYISFLMGAPTLSEAELRAAGVEILERFAPSVFGVLVGPESVARYRQLVLDRLRPGFWNDLVSRHEIRFLFKLADSTIRELTLCERNREEISRLCSQLNGDPIEETYNLPEYFASNAFYRDVMVACHGASGRER